MEYVFIQISSSMDYKRFRGMEVHVKLNGGFVVNFYYFFEVKSGTKSLLMDGF